MSTKTISRISLVIVIVLGFSGTLYYPVQAQTETPPPPRDALIQAIQERAQKDVEMGAAPQSPSDLAVLFSDQATAVGMSMNEIKDISYRLKYAFQKRAQQADQVSRHIQASPYPVIVCGDFNDTPVSYSYRTIRKDLQDAYTGSGRGIGNTYSGFFLQ